MKRAAVIVCAVLLLVACGGGANPAVGQIKAAYTSFFSTKTSLAAHVALVQDGPKFRSLIKGFIGNPLANNVSATVSSVTMQGADKAKVVYTVKIPLLTLSNQTGYAVRQGGKWKVASATICALVSMEGGPPAVCKS